MSNVPAIGALGNHFFVGAKGDYYVILRQPIREMTGEEALNLAANLVALADPSRERFDQVLQEVLNT